MSRLAGMASRYWHTLRHLRREQIFGRIRHRLHRPAVDPRPAPARRNARAAWPGPALRPVSLLEPWRFRFLNETRDVATSADWNRPDWPKLWLYNLHYFDDLNAVDADVRAAWHREWIARWMRENPPAAGNGWEPYPTSLRIVNWIKWALRDGELPAAALDSLAMQTRWLHQRLERHLLGNHLFSNAKALVFAGRFFDGNEADAWLDTGMRLLEREIPEQILPDGGQFERSPMYHALALEDMLDLIALWRVFPPTAGDRRQAMVDSWSEVIARMRCWLATMCHPDGGIGFFNDAAFGIAPTRDALETYAAALALPEQGGPVEGITHLADSGYLRMQNGPALLLLDVAPVGPDYLPGHAHADTLSFEWSLFGRRVIVNSGTSTYGSDALRQRQRGTTAHSTVTIDGEDSSEVWKGFRVARRARPFGLALEQEGQLLRAVCSHDGYRRLPGRPVHRREWALAPGRLMVCDAIVGSFRTAIARFHLHPEVAVQATGNAGTLSWPGAPDAVRWRVGGADVRITPSAWYPEFGASMPSLCLEMHVVHDRCEAVFEW